MWGVDMENLFEYYLENDNLHFKYAKGEPAVKEQEFHDYNEFVFFVKGEAFFISKNIQQKLVPGSVIIIPKENFHQFCVTSPENYVRCILGFKDNTEFDSLTQKVINTINVISVPDEKVTYVFENLIEVVMSDLSDKEKELYVYAALVHLLVFFKLKPFMEINNNVHLSQVVSGALGIIDERYNDNLSVESIAKTLYVSPSTLAHEFRKELNISVYRYITKKRLSVAHKLIQQGDSMSSAASKSGFSDYSCFYRLYKKYYRIASENHHI